MQIDQIVQEPDGSAWTAVVRVRGVMFVASYVANTLNVRLGPYKHAPRRPPWALDSVKAWAAAQVAALPPDWLIKHQQMYA